MNDNKVLSIAIPTYNMEKYLRRCVDSLIAPQVLPQLEIIIVNDGSKDDSLAIAQRYRDKYPDSVTLIDKPNGNYGSCINAALKIARGKYFRILDADDWFDRNSLIQFIHCLENTGVDMAITNFSKEFAAGDNEVYVKNTAKIPAGKPIPFPSFDFEGQGYIYLIAMHADTYRTQMLRDMHYKQTEGISYTDTEYCFYPLEHVKTFLYCDVVLYRYYFGHEGQTVSEASIKKNKDQYRQLSHQMAQYLLDKRHSPTATLRKQQCAILMRIAKNYYLSLLIFNDKTEKDDAKLKELDQLIREVDEGLYKKMDDVDFHGVKYIQIWRRKGIYFSNPKHFRLKKSILKLRGKLKKNPFIWKISRKLK